MSSVITTDGVAITIEHSRGPTTKRDAPVVIVCHGFVQNRFAFEAPARSLLEQLRSLGVCVAVIELRGRTGTDMVHGLHEYTDLDAPAVIAALAQRHSKVAWLGHSMGGLIAALLPPAARDQLAAVVTIGAPLLPGRAGLHCFGGRSTSLLMRLARAAHARGRRFRGRLVSNGLHALRGLLDVPWLPAPLRLWAPGSIGADALAFSLTRSFTDDSYAVFADLLELVVTDGARAGRIDAGERLAAFTRPILVIAGDLDDLAPPSAARPLFERVGSVHKEYLEIGAAMGTKAGHLDLLVGHAAPALVWPPIARFLRRHLALSAP